MNTTAPMTSVPADHAARERATDIHRSCIVSAPAGSGKTALLTLRVLKLLAKVTKPEEILCMTFTRKAAQEMRERIFHALEAAGDGATTEVSDSDYIRELAHAAQAALSNDRQRDWQLLQSPERLKITTIDGFCYSLCAQLPFLSGIGAETGVAEFSQAFYERATERWLERALSDPDDAHIAVLLTHFGGRVERVRALLVKLLSVREQWLPLVIQSRQNRQWLRGYFEATLRQWLDDELAELAPCLRPLTGDITALQHYACRHAEGAANAELLRTLARYPQLPDYRSANLDYWRALANFLLTKSDASFRKRLDKNLGFPTKADGDAHYAKAQKQRFAELVAKLEAQGAGAERWDALRSLPDPIYDDGQWLTLDALLALLPGLAAELKVEFIQTSQADFSEFAMAAVRALAADDGDMQLQQKLDYRIGHILVDEFQDTSQLQLALLSNLCREWQAGDGKTLFLVGDGMQSCYGFRNANVGIFLGLRERGLPNIELEAVNLSVNFRSDARIIDWVNTVFSRSFPERDDIHRGAVRYIPSQAAHADAVDAGVHCHGFLKDTDKGSSAEAEFIAATTAKLREQSPGASIAVLGRSRAALHLIVQAFSKRGIDYRAIDIDPLLSRQYIVDIMNLCRLICEPQDSLSLLALLRSPFCALNHRDLSAVFAPGGEADTRVLTVEERLVSGLAGAELSRDGRVRLERFAARWEALRAQRQRKSLSAVAEHTWIEWGGDALLADDAERRDLDTYLALLRTSERAGFIDDWEAFEKTLAGLFASPQQHSDNPVQLMTMHKSKGLEFDHVFLPALSVGARADDPAALYWLERFEPGQEDNHFVLSPIQPDRARDSDALTRFIRDQQSRKARYEQQRVFYVACTRARKRLYLSASFKPDEDNGSVKAPAASSMLGPSWPLLHEQFLWHAADAKPEPDTALAEHPTLQAIDPRWRHPEFDTQLQPKEPFNNRGLQIATSDPGHSAAAVARGIVYHRILQTLGEDGLEPFFRRDLGEYHAFWRSQLIEARCPRADLDTIVTSISDNLRALQHDPVFNWLFSRDHAERLSECALYDCREQHYREYVLDCSFREGAVRWLIDFKTLQTAETDADNTAFEAQLSIYQAQLQHYAELLRNLENQGELSQSQHIKCALYLPFSKRLHVIDSQAGEHRPR